MLERIKELLSTDLSCSEIVEELISEKFTLSYRHEQDYREFVQAQVDKVLIELA